MVLPQSISDRILEEVKEHMKHDTYNKEQLEFDFVSDLKKRNPSFDDYTGDKVTGLVFFGNQEPAISAAQ